MAGFSRALSSSSSSSSSSLARPENSALGGLRTSGTQSEPHTARRLINSRFVFFFSTVEATCRHSVWYLLQPPRQYAWCAIIMTDKSMARDCNHPSESFASPSSATRLIFRNTPPYMLRNVWHSLTKTSLSLKKKKNSPGKFFDGLLEGTSRASSLDRTGQGSACSEWL